LEYAATSSSANAVPEIWVAIPEDKMAAAADRDDSNNHFLLVLLEMCNDKPLDVLANTVKAKRRSHVLMI
jgi:hypothetical protein